MNNKARFLTDAFIGGQKYSHGMVARLHQHTIDILERQGIVERVGETAAAAPSESKAGAPSETQAAAPTETKPKGKK